MVYIGTPVCEPCAVDRGQIYITGQGWGSFSGLFTFGTVTSVVTFRTETLWDLVNHGGPTSTPPGPRPIRWSVVTALYRLTPSLSCRDVPASRVGAPLKSLSTCVVLPSAGPSSPSGLPRTVGRSHTKTLDHHRPSPVGRTQKFVTPLKILLLKKI